MPDIYSSPIINISVKDKKGRYVPIIEKRILKPPLEELSYYEYVFPFNLKGIPSSVKIDICGYGGQGISFLKIAGKNKEFVPEEILKTKGEIYQPSHLLKDNLQWCYIGLHDSTKGFVQNEYRKIPHIVEIKLNSVTTSEVA